MRREEELKEINKIKQLSLLNKMAKPFIEIREAEIDELKEMFKELITSQK